MDDDLDRYLPPITEDVARAVVHRETRRTFAELDADANRVANALAARGVVRNQRVAIYSHNS